MQILKVFTKQKQKSKVIEFGAKILVFLALFLLPNLASASSLSDIEQQIRQVQQQLNQTTTQRKTLQGEVQYFDNQIYLTQLQINKINAEILQLQNDIAATQSNITVAENNLKEKKSQLSEIVRIIYEDGQISNLELIASSNNFSDFVNKSEYLETINIKIADITNSIVQLKKELETKKAALEVSVKKQQDLKSAEVGERQTLNDQRYSKDIVLQKTKGQESAYTNLMKQLYAERERLATETGQTIGGSGTGGYPYTNSCGGIDPWLFYKCQCTSYASWYWNARLGKSWTNSRPGQGNAYNWYNLAGDQGYSWDYTPRIGDIAVWPITGTTPYGHVAIVSGVSGSTISVYEYNWTHPEGYGTRSGIGYSGLKFIH